MNSLTLKNNLLHKTRVQTDVLGLEVGAGLSRGVPAVRLRCQNNKIELLAAGFLPLDGSLPEKSADAEHPLVWQVPKKFAAPHAAISVTSSLGVIRHTTGIGEDFPEKKNMLYREVYRVLGADIPPLLAAIPDFQASWVARLFPEGRRPTACSLQLTSLAAMCCFQRYARLRHADGCCVVFFVFQTYTAMVAFQRCVPVLYREHPLGARHIQQEVASRMQMDCALVNQFMEDASVDLSLIFESILRPLFRQVEIISDYVSRRRNTQVSRYYLSGAAVGQPYWTAIFKQMIQSELEPFCTFDGLQMGETDEAVLSDLKSNEPLFLGATGAALAVLEDK